MKKLKAIAVLLSVAAVLCTAGCGDNGGSGNAATTTTVDDDIVNPVDVGDLTVDIGVDPSAVEPTTLTYLGTYDFTKAGDIKPSVKYFEQNYNCKIEVQQVAWDQIEEAIATGVSSGNSADLVDRNDSTFPHWMYKNMYTPLDDYIDLTLPQWEGLETYIDGYKWNGKHYYYPWSYSVDPEMCIYNRAKFEEKGIQDPYELYRNGNWTWDTFKQCMIDFVGDDTTKLGFYGYYATSFIDSNGIPFVDLDASGKLVCNMNSSVVEQAQNFLMDLRKQKLGSLGYETLSNVDINPVIAGDAAFQIMGGWVITNYAVQQQGDDSLDIFFVPIPRSPNTDEYYHSLSTFGYLVPAGSQNAQQAATFINCCRMSLLDEELKAKTKTSEMKNKKYTDEMYDFLQEFKDPTAYKCIIDDRFGMSTETVDIIKKMLADVAFNTEEMPSWTTLRDQYSGIVQGEIDTYNASIA